jgi:hypothetical protein
MRKGYYLFPATALDSGATIEITDSLSGSKVDLWENGIGGVAGNVKLGRIYKAVLTADDGKKIGWYFRGCNFDRGYNYFN